ncbi:LysR family transcriptional regulator [Aureimonas leprariae]|uniref:LysR family transcriptional regulator n=1 Tax=Plantimonas leprariae TaxID=2615207 RepID=A0A7V7TUU7_9HYPH|nr:LysR family transcriptional regulator [Aureimonas leprariae]KAB0676398.1 LysR family transcriptional regulator [Aureimonas leprariae]
MEHVPDGMDWNGIRIFLAVAERQSFRQAAADLGCSQSTVKLGIERLEDQLGFKLFYRDVGGARLTAEGRRLASSARHVEQSVSDLWRVAQSAADTMSGSVHLAVTEGIGTFWLLPQLVNFLENRGRDIRVNLQCALRSVDVLRLEADISIQLTEPTAPELLKRRLGTIHLNMFAGRSYAERFGLPGSVAELADHRIIAQEMEQFGGYGLADIFTPEIAERMVRVRTNFASAQYWAIAKGAGLGMLPNYATAIGGDLVPVDIDLGAKVGVWLAVHPEVVKTARHRAVVDWLVDCFSAKRFPWFGDRALHPREIERLLQSSADLRTYFEGFTPTRLIEDASAEIPTPA